MIQVYTKNKPTRSGHYWATESLEKAPIIYHVGTHDHETELTIDTNEGYLSVDHPVFDDILWGHCPIPEPLGSKI